MAPKRPAPPPAAASSEETASGSGSDESEEEEIAHSPPPAAPKNTAPPPHKGQEYETSDEDEDDEEEEEEEDEKVSHVTLPSATKNPSPPPPNREESETSDEEEEEETDDEAPQPKPAPNQEAERKGAKPSSSSEDKKAGAPFQRIWSTDDEVHILEALAAHRREHGTLPQPDALVAALADSLVNSGRSRSELQGKVKSLKRRYNLATKKGELPSKDHERRFFDLSKTVWGPAATARANGGARREFGEMCKLYPYLAEEVKALEKAHPGLFKREFAMIDDDKARALDVKIKRQRMVQMKLELRRHDLTKEVTRTLMDLVE